MPVALEVDGVAFDAECGDVLFDSLPPFDRLPEWKEWVIQADGVSEVCGGVLDASRGRLAPFVRHGVGGIYMICENAIDFNNTVGLCGRTHLHGTSGFALISLPSVAFGYM